MMVMIVAAVAVLVSRVCGVGTCSNARNPPYVSR